MSLVHASAYLVQAGQALLWASNQAELLAAERTRYRDDMKAERDKAKSLKNSLKLANAKLVELKKERDEALEKAKKVEGDLCRMQRLEKKKIKEVDEKAYQAGYDRAGAESIPTLVTSELVLPCTEEECAPLPLEEFPESDDDVEDISDAKAGDGSRSKKVAEDAAGEKSTTEDARNVEQEVAKNAEETAKVENVEKD
ncbi:hypothetical protein RHMOL_Rhmol11G0035500 [Rhododendron molle]|uniref:Uncharacterized protein n=1 Tax=Rhododendron molle TaxID=49168 RepID=A0ACC0LP54_RHOML|nr:hypothetical protein RHMOL_Rhmol11G0035500 [Rhododendron molle]